MCSSYSNFSRSNCEVLTRHSPSCSDLMTFVGNDIRDIGDIQGQGQGFLSPLMFDLGSPQVIPMPPLLECQIIILCICQRKVEIDF